MGATVFVFCKASNRDVVRYVLLSHFFQIGQDVLWFFFLPQLDFKIPGRV